MGTDTKAQSQIPKHIQKYLDNTVAEFDRVMQDPPTLQCFARYSFALLDKLGVRRHWLRENVFPGSEALPDIDLPTAEQEEKLLLQFAETVRARHPSFHAVYEEHIHSQLRRLSCAWLAQYAGYEESQASLYQAAKAIPHKITRQWDNPLRFVTDPVTGERTVCDVTSRTKPALIFSALGFLKNFEPVGKVGRPKGISKPAGSGRKPSVRPEIYKAAWEAKQASRKHLSIPWWITFARAQNIPIPEIEKPREALRKKLEQWAINGKSLSRKKSEI